MLEGFRLFFRGIMRHLFIRQQQRLFYQLELTSKPTTISMIEANDVCDHIAL